jgi:hypothetical protein
MNDSIPNDDTILDTVGAARYLAMSAHYVVKHTKVEPLIPFSRFGGRLRFKVADLREFLAARQSKKA